MRAGGFDRLITIQQRSIARDAAGGEIETWTTFATAWAQKNDKAGREYFAANKETGMAVTQFTIRYIAGVQLQMRISHDGLLYDISDIAEITRRKGLVIMAHAVQA